MASCKKYVKFCGVCRKFLGLLRKWKSQEIVVTILLSGARLMAISWNCLCPVPAFRGRDLWPRGVETIRGDVSIDAATRGTLRGNISHREWRNTARKQLPPPTGTGAIF